MLKQIASVTATRYLIALINLALIFINAKTLGTEGLGTIALIWAAININVTINSIFANNTLVYFANRHSIRHLYPIALTWTITGSLAGSTAMHLIGIIPPGYTLHTSILTILYSLPITHSRLLLSCNDIKAFNLANFLQGATPLPILLIIYMSKDMRNVDSYLLALHLAYAITLLASLAMLLPRLRQAPRPQSPIRPIIKEMLIYGLWSSVDNIAENLTTRLNYFLIEHHLGRSAVGILDAATRITESILHTSRSIAHIQYNKIAQTTNPALQTAITLQALKYALAALLLLAALLTLVPGDIYTKYLFTPAFGNLRHIILILSPGIVILGLNTILSHYFIGSGRIKYSAFTSIVGLLTLLIAGTTLVPSRGITGSALATLIAFSAMTTFSGTLFFIKHKANQ